MTETDILIRLALAVLVGFFIGLEREKHHRPAGIKTHILVCVGATVISLIQLQIIDDIVLQVSQDPSLSAILRSDHGRLGAQVISGIGFLGAGTIIRTRGSVKGLTTAATLWLVACLGLGIGFGYYVISIAAFLIVMLILIFIKFLQPFLVGTKGSNELEIILVNKKTAMEEINRVLNENFVEIKKIDFPDDQDESYHHDVPVYKYSYTIKIPTGIEIQKIINELNVLGEVIKAVEASN